MLAMNLKNAEVFLVPRVIVGDHREQARSYSGLHQLLNIRQRRHQDRLDPVRSDLNNLNQE
ncbi:hypothetical protein [Pseudomonas fluorescens]|uniref:hypothetical protein n=1 Tax=Pseudomonas fluorescens TaxID=294 RepID=UPI00123F6C08|nr:hypothetical protein [Pseudomonas fluorescens]